jgi:hypothetical protein
MGGGRERERDRGNKTGSPSKSVAFNGSLKLDIKHMTNKTIVNL